MAAGAGTTDLFVIGGGINGCGIARDAAGRGLSVTLAEQGDLPRRPPRPPPSFSTAACAISSTSSSAWSARRSRSARPFFVAMPHISWPMRFVLPQPGDALESDTPTARSSRALGLLPSTTASAAAADTSAAHPYLDLTTDPAGRPLQPRLPPRLRVLRLLGRRLPPRRPQRPRRAGTRRPHPDPHPRRLGRARGRALARRVSDSTAGRRSTGRAPLVNAGGPWVEAVIRDVAHARRRPHPPGPRQPHRHPPAL